MGKYEIYNSFKRNSPKQKNTPCRQGKKQNKQTQLAVQSINGFYMLKVFFLRSTNDKYII